MINALSLNVLKGYFLKIFFTSFAIPGIWEVIMY